MTNSAAITTMKEAYSPSLSTNASCPGCPRATPNCQRMGSDTRRATSALLVFECHHPGTASGARAITTSKSAKGIALHSGSCAPSWATVPSCTVSIGATTYIAPLPGKGPTVGPPPPTPPPHPESAMQPRHPAESETVMSELMMPQHANLMGNVFGGVILSLV